MIDLHSHLLPGCDDGAPDMEASLSMARHAVEQGTTIMACTPHIYPGKYDNHGAEIRVMMDALQRELDAQAIELQLVVGADAHIRPDFLPAIQSGEIPTLGDAGYVLMEPPHQIRPPNLPRLVGEVLEAGYVPVITHPERLGWVRQNYDDILAVVRLGAAVQITAASVTGGFGKRARALSLKMLHDGIVDIVASDAHSLTGRPPGLRQAHGFLSELMGQEAADQMTQTAPRAMLDGAVLPRRAKLLPGAWQETYAVEDGGKPKAGLVSRLLFSKRNK